MKKSFAITVDGKKERVRNLIGYMQGITLTTIKFGEQSPFLLKMNEAGVRTGVNDFFKIIGSGL